MGKVAKGLVLVDVLLHGRGHAERIGSRVDVVGGNGAFHMIVLVIRLGEDRVFVDALQRGGRGIGERPQIGKGQCGLRKSRKRQKGYAI